MNTYIFAVHRGGSCILGDIAKICADQNLIKTQLIGSEQFPEVGESGCAVKDGDRFIPNVKNWLVRSGIFAPIRRPDFFPQSIVKKNDRLIINIRDPRDCMVSGYYGFLKLHDGGLKNPENKKKFDAGIDRYVLEDLLSMYKNNYEAYIDLIESCGISVLKYEEMVTSFDSWFIKFYKSLGLDGRYQNFCRDLCKDFFLPSDEDDSVHKRKMLPGDYLEKLESNTIHTLDEEFSDILDYFGYGKSDI